MAACDICKQALTGADALCDSCREAILRLHTICQKQPSLHQSATVALSRDSESEAAAAA